MLTESSIQHKPRQTRPCSRKAGSSLFCTAGMIKSGRRPWKTELSCNAYLVSFRPLAAASGGQRAYRVDALEERDSNHQTPKIRQSSLETLLGIVGEGASTGHARRFAAGWGGAVGGGMAIEILL